MTGIGLNGATLPGRDLITKMRDAAATGFDFYEPRVPELVAFDTPEGALDVRQALDETGLSWLPLNALEGVFSSLAGGADAALSKLATSAAAAAAAAGSLDVS